MSRSTDAEEVRRADKAAAMGRLMLGELHDVGAFLSERPDETREEVLMRLLAQHGLGDAARALLDDLERRKHERQMAARHELLAHVLDGEEPPTREEMDAVRREWEG